MFFQNFVVLTYGFLCLAILSLWMPTSKESKVVLVPSSALSSPELFFHEIKKSWMIFLILAICCGLVCKTLTPLALMSIIPFVFAMYSCQKEQANLILKIIAGIIVFLLSLGLSMHFLPGFNNLKIL